MIYHVTLAGRTVTVEVDGGVVTVDGRTMRVDMETAGSVRSLLVEGRAHRLVARGRGAGRWHIQLGARALDAEVVDERTKVIRAMTGQGAGARGPKPVRAPMPGMVVRVDVQEGDRVVPGQGVVIVEAMKMENELVAEGEGRVDRILVAQGEAVEKDQLLVSLVPFDDDPPGDESPSVAGEAAEAS